MYKKILYGNPYTGLTSKNKKEIEKSLKEIGKLAPYKVSHIVDSIDEYGNDVEYKWVVGKGKLR